MLHGVTGEYFMYAIVETGGKQYRVSEGDTLRVEKMQGEPGEEILFDKILLVGGGEGVRVGTPFLEDVRVRGEILAQRRGRKVLVFKFKRRKDYRRKQGHRQDYTGIRIKAIEQGQTSPPEGEK
jgi:large subunit ribosomal protein L21